VTNPGGTIMVMDGWWFSSRDAERGGFNARDYNGPMFSIEKATAEMMASWVSGEVPPNSMYVNETILKRLRRHPGRTVIAAYFDGHVAPISEAKPEDFAPY
jgi:prepilin-type processing-associated H-X9-DG protein